MPKRKSAEREDYGSDCEAYDHACQSRVTVAPQRVAD
jgi:hypothetical protein